LSWKVRPLTRLPSTTHGAAVSAAVAGNFSRDFTVAARYLVIPVNNGAKQCRLTLKVDGEAARTYSEKSDLIRFETLVRRGGVYIDTDFQPLKPIEQLLHGFEAFGGTEDGYHLSTGLIGCVPGHHIFQAIVEALGTRWTGATRNASVNSGPIFVTKFLRESGLFNKLHIFPKDTFFPGDYCSPSPEEAAGRFPAAGRHNSVSYFRVGPKGGISSNGDHSIGSLGGAFRGPNRPDSPLPLSPHLRPGRRDPAPNRPNRHGPVEHGVMQA